MAIDVSIHTCASELSSSVSRCLTSLFAVWQSPNNLSLICQTLSLALVSVCTSHLFDPQAPVNEAKLITWSFYSSAILFPELQGLSDVPDLYAIKIFSYYLMWHRTLPRIRRASRIVKVCRWYNACFFFSWKGHRITLSLTIFATLYRSARSSCILQRSWRRVYNCSSIHLKCLSHSTNILYSAMSGVLSESVLHFIVCSIACSLSDSRPSMQIALNKKHQI